MHKDQSLYQGLLKTIGNRSLPTHLRACVAGETFARADSAPFRSAHPFPHIVLDNFLTPEFCQQLLIEFPPFHPEYAVDENGAIGGKATHNDIRSIGPAYQTLDELIQTRAFLDLMSSVTGIPDLLYDPEYLGGGTHENLDGQSLDFHVDFNYHHKRRWHRRINLILFLNEHWEEDWGGCLELRENPGEPGDVRLPPRFNRAVIFETNEVSWHGFSNVSLPAGSNVSRKTVALYFYTKDRPVEEKAPPRSTVYVEELLPGHLVEGHTLSADDMVILHSLIDRRDSHIARLYQHERDLTARVFELEEKGSEKHKHVIKSVVDSITRNAQRVRHKIKPAPEPEKAAGLAYVQFSKSDARHHMLEGWGEPESSMVWSLGPCSELELEIRKREALNLNFECRPFTYPDAPGQSITVYLNDTLQGTVTLSDDKQTYTLPLDETHQQPNVNRLRFEYGYALSPREIGISDDDRRLGVAWFNLWLSGAR